MFHRGEYMRKSGRKLIVTAAFFIFAVMQFVQPVQAKASDTIEDGIYVGNIDVSGKTIEEARQAVTDYIDGLKELTVTFEAVEGNQETATIGELGINWTNPEVINDAAGLGKKGNVVQRYKALQDLRHENKVFELTYDFDKELIRQFVQEQCEKYNIEALDATLIKTENGFSVTPGTNRLCA